MPQGRMALAVDSAHRPIEVGALRWSSAASPWVGLPVECHALAPRGNLEEYGLEQTLLGLCVGGNATLRVGDGSTRRRVRSIPGRFSLLARGFEQRSIAWNGAREMVYVGLSADDLERLASHEAACLNVDPQYAVSDPQVVSIVLNMRNEILAGCPTGRIYGEALSLALAAYLFGRYSLRGTPAAPRGISLSATQVHRVREYVSQNLERDIGLSDLADQVGLSPHYFSTLFKHAFGVSPHRYVLSERVHEAKRLLCSGQVPISEVALRLGFADQSHFSHVFRTFAGTTPKRFQTMC